MRCCLLHSSLFFITFGGIHIKKKGNKVKTVLTVIAIIILLFILVFLICLKLATTDDNTDKYYTTPSLDPAQTIAISALAGNQASITEDDVNALVAYLIQKATETGMFKNDCKITGAFFEINSGKPCRCYFQIEYKERKYGFSADIDISIDESSNQIKIAFSNAAVGRLKIPRSLIISVLKLTGIQEKTEYLSIDDLTLNIPTHYGIDVPVLGTVIGIDIEAVRIYEDEIQIDTNPIVSDTINDIKGIIGDKISDFIDNYIPDSIGDYFG